MISAESAYLFRHALLRDAAYQVWTPSERGRMHLHAADSIEALHGGAAALALEMAAHLRASAALKEDDTLAAREAACLDRGADHAWRVYDHSACLAALSRLLELTGAAEARARVCDRLASAFDRVGRMGEAAGMVQETARLTTDAQLRASALGRACWFLCYMERLEEARQCCRQLETLAADGGPGVRRKASSARAILHYFDREFGAAIQATHEAVALAMSAGAPAAELTSDLSNLAALKLRVGDLDGAEETGQQAAQLARETGKLEMQALTWHILADAAMGRGDAREAERRRREGLAAALAAASPTRTAQARYQLGLLLLNTGRPEEALTELALAAIGYDEQGREAIACHSRFCMARAHIWAGRLERARRELDDVAAVGPPDSTSRVLPRLGHALLALARQDGHAALQCLESLPAPSHPGEAALLGQLRARALAMTGRFEEALARFIDQANEDHLFADRVIGACLRAWLLHRAGRDQEGGDAARSAAQLAGRLGQDESSPAAEVRQALAWLSEVAGA